MCWSDMHPKRRAGIRAALLFVVILIVSATWNLADETTTALIRSIDVLMALGAAGIYAGLMYMVDRKLARHR